MHHFSNVDTQPKQSGKSHFSRGNSQATFGKIMARLYHALTDSTTQGLHCGAGRLKVNLWDIRVREEMFENSAFDNFCVVRTCQFVVRCSNLIKQVAGSLERHIDGLSGIVDYADC